MEIPYNLLGNETLRNVIKEFIGREGTDYGEREYSWEDKVEQVMHQLQNGSAILVYDEKTETCSILSQNQYQRSLIRENSVTNEKEKEDLGF